MEYPVPKTSAIAFEEHCRRERQNAGLVFERFAPDWRDDAPAKKKGLEAVVKAAELADVDLLRAWNARWEAGVRAAGAEPFSLRTDWRLVAGLGRKGSLEVGFTFHRYGLPVLPGSSLKGVARAYASFVEGRGADDADFVAVFGRVPQKGEDERLAQAGQAIFFDAIPASKPKLELDVMNPHYPEYYRDGKGGVPPADWQSPVPVYFLTVAPGTEFRFAEGWRGALDDEARRLRDMARAWLINGLAQLGAGAKTSAGYGYFLLPTASPPSAHGAEQSTVSAEPVVERRGVIVEIRPDKRRGRVRDIETGQVYSFSTTVIQGNTPPAKATVIFHVEGERVVKVWRA